MKKLSLLVLLLTLFVLAFAQEKKPLDHSVYDHWKSLKNPIISNNGKFVSYEINPQQGDGWIYLYDVQKKALDSMPRGHQPEFIPGGNALVYRIKPAFDSILKKERKKIKKDKLPKDSLAVWNTTTHKLLKLGQIQKVEIPENKGQWLAILMKKETPKKKKDKKTASPTEKILAVNPGMKAKEKIKPPLHKDKILKKAQGNRLVLLNVISGDSVVFEHVTHFALSKNGKICGFIQVPRDSIDKVEVYAFNTQTKASNILFKANGYSKNISLDEQGNQLAFTFSKDSVKNKAFGLYYVNLKKDKLSLVSGKGFSKLKKGWSVSPNGKIFFNETGTELYIGTAPKPEPEVKDTLAAIEKVSLDIWNWQDKILQPQQKVQLKKERKRSYLTVYFPTKDKLTQLADPDMKEIRIDTRAKGLYCLGYDDTPYQKMTSWIGHWFKDVYLVNRTNGQRKEILKKVTSSVSLSPDQEFVAWYNIADSSWNAYNVKSGKSVILTARLPVNFYNELNDVPNEAPAYGMAGWTRNNRLVVYDDFDLWSLDPSGKTAARNLTMGEGRNDQLRFRYVKLDKDERYLPESMLLSAFQLKNKQAGFYSLEKAKLKKLILSDFAFNKPLKAKNTKSILWRKQSFSLYPDLYLSSMDFKNTSKISNTNPQQKNFLWGSVELVSWLTFDGDTMQGMLYKPANFNPAKKYPMLVYFYERSSDRLHRYYTPSPIRSVINFSYYTSNGYLIFIPDIKYKVGYPGASAFNCIISGTQAMCNRFPFIDRKRMGMQGQSWGGYQSAYLVTQTNMFRCAEAGAPVSNMTSAYGGIRWGSGMSREFQYEHTQSRIGGTLWDKLPLYIQNSPLFFVPRIQTPLLIMHNDKDNAVPWYQGIELFNALRRLNKPVWMLVYNGAPHNLSRRADEKDLTRRMQQFFDFYLKDAPEPKWMKVGISALQKGKDFGFELEK